MSRSEVDLRPKRGRSRSPDRHNCTARSASPKRGLPKPSGFRFRNITKHRMPHQMYKWDGRFACAQCGSHLLKHLLGNQSLTIDVAYGAGHWCCDSQFSQN